MSKYAEFDKEALNEYEYGKKAPTLFKKGDCILYKYPGSEAEWSGFVTQEYVEGKKEVVGWVYKIITEEQTLNVKFFEEQPGVTNKPNYMKGPQRVDEMTNVNPMYIKKVDCPAKSAGSRKSRKMRRMRRNRTRRN